MRNLPYKTATIVLVVPTMLFTPTFHYNISMGILFYFVSQCAHKQQPGQNLLVTVIEYLNE